MTKDYMKQEEINCEHCGRKGVDGPYRKGNIWYNWKLCQSCYHKWASPESFAEIVVESLSRSIKEQNE